MRNYRNMRHELRGIEPFAAGDSLHKCNSLENRHRSVRTEPVEVRTLLNRSCFDCAQHERLSRHFHTSWCWRQASMGDSFENGHCSVRLRQRRIEGRRARGDMMPTVIFPKIIFSTPLSPQSWGELRGEWGTPPNPRHPPQADCTSFKGTCSGESCTRPAGAILCPTQETTFLWEVSWGAPHPPQADTSLSGGRGDWPVAPTGKPLDFISPFPGGEGRGEVLKQWH
jgi:hypothetical protein